MAKIGRERERWSPSSGCVPLFLRTSWISHRDIISKIISRFIQKVVSNDKYMTCCDTSLTDFDHSKRFLITIWIMKIIFLNPIVSYGETRVTPKIWKTGWYSLKCSQMVHDRCRSTPDFWFWSLCRNEFIMHVRKMPLWEFALGQKYLGTQPLEGD